MFKIENGRITVTKGDTAPLTVSLFSSDGTPYAMQDGDKLRFVARESNDKEPLFEVESTTNTINLTPADTNKLIVGGCVYAVRLITAAGDKYTVLGPSSNEERRNMIVLPDTAR